MHSKLSKFLCLQLQFIPDLSQFLSTNRQQTELLKKSNAASISGSFRHVVHAIHSGLWVTKQETGFVSYEERRQYTHNTFYLMY